MNKYENIILNCEKFINVWKLSHLKIVTNIKLLDQHTFVDGTIFISPCTPYGNNSFNSEEIIFQESKNSDCNEIIRNNMENNVLTSLIFQSPFGILYSTKVVCIDLIQLEKNENYFVFAKPGTKKRCEIDMEIL